MADGVYTVRDLARLTGASVSSLHFWYNQGLLPGKKTESRILLFDETGLERLRAILALPKSVRRLADKKAMLDGDIPPEVISEARQGYELDSYAEILHELQNANVPVEAVRHAVEALIIAARGR